MLMIDHIIDANERGGIGAEMQQRDRDRHDERQTDRTRNRVSPYGAIHLDAL